MRRAGARSYDFVVAIGFAHPACTSPRDPNIITRPRNAELSPFWQIGQQQVVPLCICKSMYSCTTLVDSISTGHGKHVPFPTHAHVCVCVCVSEVCVNSRPNAPPRPAYSKLVLHLHCTYQAFVSITVVLCNINLVTASRRPSVLPSVLSGEATNSLIPTLDQNVRNTRQAFVSNCGSLQH